MVLLVYVALAYKSINAANSLSGRLTLAVSNAKRRYQHQFKYNIKKVLMPVGRCCTFEQTPKTGQTMIPQYVTYISFLITIISFIITYLQLRKNVSLRIYLKSESWKFYNDASVLLGHAQSGIEAITNDNPKQAQIEAGETEGMSQTLFSMAVRNIHHYDHFTLEKIKKWADDERILQEHEKAFKRYADK